MNEEQKELARYIAKKVQESTNTIMDYIDDRFDSLSEELSDESDNEEFDDLEETDDLFSGEPKKKYEGTRTINNAVEEEKEDELQGESAKDSIGDERGEGTQTDQGTPTKVD